MEEGNNRTPPRQPSPQSIPLQDLSRPPDDQGSTGGGFLHPQHGRARSMLSRSSRGSNYSRLGDDSPSRQQRLTPIIASYSDREDWGPPSPLDNPQDFAGASLGLALNYDPYSTEPPTTPPSSIHRPTIITTPANDNPAYGGNLFSPPDNDTTPLTDNTHLHPSLGSSASTNKGQRHDRQQKRSSVHWAEGNSPSAGRGRAASSSRLGDDLPTLDTGSGVARQLSTASGISRLSVTPSSRDRSTSLSPAPSPMARTKSIFREISGRVVNLSNDTDMVDQSVQRKSTVRRAKSRRNTAVAPETHDLEDTLPSDIEAAQRPATPQEKRPSVDATPIPPSINPSAFVPKPVYPNPLRGRSWGIFGPENPLRKFFCNVLIHPVTEPIILILIVTQTVLLAVNAASVAIYDVTRSRAWGTTKFDYAIFGLFIVYTVELVARTIVSGFISNPHEYSTLDRSVGLKQAILKKSHTLFAPQSERSARSPSPNPDSITFQPSIVRTFTGLPDVDAPGHGKFQQRMRLARRAFLRHSFNRLDFVAVVAYWISFGMQISGYEIKKHVYIFDMLSCLRILRLLGLTAGTSVILRSLKKAAPLLVHVAFLIGFFWLIFGIVGVQSFKSSLRRNCVWVGNDGSGSNYTLNIAPGGIQFCGGHLDAATGDPMPWLKEDGRNGSKFSKGHLCPQGSLCVESGNGPYNGTVSFDNIVQSLELVFVVISSNTFSDLLYYLTDSDYLAAALFFAAGIVVLSLWLMNLLVAVITSSFQIIREESRQSAFQAEAIKQPEVDEESLSKTNSLQRLYDKTHYFWIAVIIYDLVVQCLRSASMGPKRHTFIMNSETVVTFILLLEIVIRLICDWRGFWSSKRNWTDLVLAVVTTITQIPTIRNSGHAYAWLTAFQITRIYRVVLSVRVTRELVMIVFRNITGLLNLIVFVFLFTFLGAILASQLFRGSFPSTSPTGNDNTIQFFSMWNSFIGMYQILSSENWTIIMYNATQYNLIWNTAWLSAMFFILWFIIANFIILNMFIAVIQESFDVSEDEKRLQQVKMFLRQKELSGSGAGNLSLSSIFKLGRDSVRHRDALEYGHTAMEQLLKDAVVKDFLDEDEEVLSRRPTSMPLTQLTQLSVPAVDPGLVSNWWSKISGKRYQSDPNPFYTTDSVGRANEDFDPRVVAKQVVASTDNRRKAQRQYLTRHPRYNVSLYIFEPRNPIRWVCQKIVGPGRGDDRIEGTSPNKVVWYCFSAFTYTAIVAMVVLACITTPLYQREYYKTHVQGINNWFIWVDLGFAIIFAIEAFIKIIADGFFFTPHAYYRSVWGFIDGIVLITLWINVLTAMFNANGVSRAVGAFKALRALRLLNISDSARDTFHSVIIVGGYKVLAAAFVSMSLLIPFAILGVNLFNGQMESCNDGNFGYSSLGNCVGEYNSTPFNWEVLAPRQVTNPYYSFDDFPSSLFILFQIVSQEGWIDVMTTAMSLTGRGLQPELFASQGNAVYFIIFNLLGAVFVLTLFISVFIRNYTEQTGVAFLTGDQRSWLELRKLLKQVSPSKRSIGETSTTWIRWCYNLSVKKRGKWQRFITGLLLAHLTLLIIEFYPEPDWWTQLRQYVFLVFTMVLLANVIVRIIGLSWKRFRRSSWDVYSILSISGTLITSILSLSFPNDTAVDQLQKLFLVSLVFLLIPRNNQLDQLFKTAAASLPLIANLMATWFVLFLVFAIALTQTFGLTRFGSNETGNLNFRDVPRALILLFRTSVGEGWNQIMEDFAQVRPPFCVQDNNFFNSDCGSEGWARALFVAWNIISMYIFVSLFVSLIFESFSYVYQRSSGLSVVSRDEVRRFKQAWAEFDPNGTGYISKMQFPRLLGELSGIFQMRIYEGDFTVKNLVEDCSPRVGETATLNGRIVDGLDIDKLSERLSHIPVSEIRKRRQRMEVFYQEVMLSADPDRGISFTSCLMILAHYNVIEDSRSLRLEEFLRRRARLQRVHESLRRDVVRGFFDTMYWSRRFKQAVEQRRHSRLGAPPQFTVPEILIEDPEESSSSVTPHDFTDSRPLRSPTKSTSPKLARLDTSMVSSHSPGASPRASFDLSPRASPTLSPRPRLSGVDTVYHGASGTGRSPPLTPTLGHSRHGSNASELGAQGVMESFDLSAWGESIKRSLTTTRRRSSER